MVAQSVGIPIKGSLATDIQTRDCRVHNLTRIKGYHRSHRQRRIKGCHQLQNRNRSVSPGCQITMALAVLVVCIWIYKTSKRLRV